MLSEMPCPAGRPQRSSFLIRMTLVPAVISLFGERAYWLPRWLDRVLPNVDVEGEKLRHQLDDKSPVGA